jgi:ribosome-binding protein aMBF1 (putative translation factor)
VVTTFAGTAVADDVRGKLGAGAYRQEHERLAPFEGLARIVIMQRAALGISQAELARRMSTSSSVVSRTRAASTPAASER